MRNSFFILSLSILVTLANVSCAAVKVTDPNDPHFDISQLRLEDYHDPNKFRAAMYVLFPVGASKTHMDKVLIGIAQARLNERKGKTLTSAVYSKRTTTGLYPCVYIVEALFDKSDMLKENVSVNTGCDAP